MKFTAILLLVFCLEATASVNSQTITYSAKNAPLEKVLSVIRKQSGYVFFYTYSSLKEAIPVSINVKNAGLQEVLDICFKDQPLTYRIVDKTIVVKQKEALKSDNLLPDKKLFNTTIDIDVSGNIADMATGSPLAGATVKLKGSGKSTTTDENGNFTIQAPASATVLVISYVGYETAEVKISTTGPLKITLKRNESKSEEVIVIGYGTQKKGNVTGSVSSVKSEELTTAPVASTANTLAGRLPGLISLQSSGQPGSDQAALSIRGFGQALWIVDGVETNFNNIDPNQIESLSILKDASASIYGARAGNGVILVTTKRGKDQKPVITLNSSYTLQGITAMTKPTSSGQYAELQNERFTNQGLTAPYTADQIQKYYNGTDPQYPNTNWFKETIRDWSPQQQHNLSVRGGSDKIKYYGFFGYLDQESLWKSNGGKYGRYNLQSNIDAKITDNLSIQVDLSSVVENRKFPWRTQSAGPNSLWQDLWNSLPIYPAALPDPTKNSYANGQGVGSIKLISDYNIAGYDQNTSQNLKGTFVANYKIRSIQGLSAKAFINYEQNYQDDKNFTKPYDFYTYDVASQKYSLAGALGTQARDVLQNNEYKNITGQLSLNYDHVFGRDHHLTALALYEAIDYKTSYILAGRDNFLTPAIEQLFAGAVQTSQATGSATEMGRASYVGRINYSYKDKYLLETTLRADASAKFPSNKRWGYFPGISLGWRVNRESFMENITAIDELKIRGSYGSSGLDNVGNFQYLSGYQFDGQWLIGANTQVGLVSTGLANPNLTWETIKIYNGGVDFSLWRRKVFGGADVFYRELSGIPATRILSLPNTFGASLPQENLNSQNNRGFELTLGTSGSIRNFSYEISGNLSWSRAKWNHFEEQNYTDPDQKRIYQLSGKWTDVQYGYKSDGLFTSQDEISKLNFTYPAGNSSLRPGDIRYVDVNHDGVLDWRDQVDIGKGTVPNWMVGSTIKLKYQHFDLSLLFQGAFGYYNYIQLDHGNINYTEVMYNLRWSDKNNSANAFFPRIGGSTTNSFVSDHFYKKAGYLRLKALSIGYNAPKQIIEKLKLQGLRLYFSGTNLLTFNKLKEYQVDPESPSNNAAYYYPQLKTVSFGVNVSF
ncbi:MAG TPA: TonB-dependent receptor [Puia sp.]|nr:TonB-dependent receptor [Puia sp.]